MNEIETPEHLIRASWYPLTDWSRGHIEYQKFKVLRRTPKGVWIQMPWMHWVETSDGKRYVKGEKWVSLHTKKRYAYPTEEEARESLFHRQVRAYAIHKYRMEQAIEAINAVKGDGYFDKIIWE